MADFTAYAVVIVPSCLAFGLVPTLANGLIKRQRKRFNDWFDAGAQAFATATSDTDSLEAERGRAWEQEVVRLSADGSLGVNQIRRASKLLSRSLDDGKSQTQARLLDADPIRSVLPVTVLACALTTFTAIQLLGATLPAVLVSLITALGLCLAITDIRARLIPNVLIIALCVAGVLLRLACNQQSELVMLVIVAALAVGTACGMNVLRAHRYPGQRAIGGGDVKALAALVLCSGSHGLLWACIAMSLAVVSHERYRRIRFCQSGKLPLGPSIGAALTIGAITSAF